MALRIVKIAMLKVKRTIQLIKHDDNQCFSYNFCLTGKRKLRKLEKSKKSRKASTDDDKTDKSKAGSSSDSEDDRKHADKNKKARDTSRTGKFFINSIIELLIISIL